MRSAAWVGSDGGVSCAEGCGWQAVRVSAIRRTGGLTPDATGRRTEDYGGRWRRVFGARRCSRCERSRAICLTLAAADPRRPTSRGGWTGPGAKRSIPRPGPSESIEAAIIDAALHGYDATAFSRVEAKLMYRRDLQRAAKELSGTS